MKQAKSIKVKQHIRGDIDIRPSKYAVTFKQHGLEIAVSKVFLPKLKSALNSMA